MTVYVVQFHIDYEGSQFIGVFSSEEKAKTYIEAQRKDEYGDYYIDEYELDEELQ